MEWFKHSTGSHDDPDVSDAMDEFGHAGYSVFFITLEVYGSEFNHLDPEGWLTLSKRFLARKLRLSQAKVELILNFYSERQRIFTKTSKNTISINCPKFVDISSNWTKRKNPTPTEALQRPYVAPTAKEEEEKKKRREEETTLGQDSDEIKLSELLFSLIQKRDPKATKPDFQKWGRHIGRIIRLDNRSPVEIRSVIIWCQDDSFWMNNILSTGKLRDKFQTLVLKMKGNGDGTRDNKRAGTPYPYARRGPTEQGGLGLPAEYKPEAAPVVSEEDRKRNLDRLKELTA